MVLILQELTQQQQKILYEHIRMFVSSRWGTKRDWDMEIEGLHKNFLNFCYWAVTCVIRLCSLFLFQLKW